MIFNFVYPRPRNRILLATAMALALSLAVAGCGAAQASNSSAPLNHLLPAKVRTLGSITVPSAVENAPFEYYPPGTKIPTGLDIDIMKAIGKELGLKFNFVNFDFASIIPSLQNGRFIIADSSMSDTSAREKQVDFVDYFINGEQIVVKRGNPEHITSYADLSGKTVALAVGDTDLTVVAQENKVLAAAGKAPIKGLVLPGSPEDLLAIDSGRAVATITGSAPGAYEAKTTHKYETVGPIVDRGPFGIVFPKNSTKFEKAIQAALNALKADGKYQAILAKWGEADGALKAFPINDAKAYGQ